MGYWCIKKGLNPSLKMCLKRSLKKKKAPCALISSQSVPIGGPNFHHPQMLFKVANLKDCYLNYLKKIMEEF